MDHKIVSTAYVPLRPPYQIIKYEQDVAMQIGTLIVTIQKGGKEYQIETHSHPVISYENKDRDGLADNQLTDHQFLEGAVWNNVEVRDVTTVCLTGATLTWKQFLEVLEYETCWHQISEREFRDIQKYRHFSVLLKTTFVHIIVGGMEQKMVTEYNTGKPRDRVQFMKKANELINWGK